MRLAIKRDVDDRSSECLPELRILAFGVDNNNLVVCCQKPSRDFFLDHERFTGTGSTEDQAVIVGTVFPVVPDHVS